MKKLSSLMMLPVLFCGLAFAQSDRRDPQYDRRDDNAYPRDEHRRDRSADERITNGPVVEQTGETWATVAWSTNTGGSSIVRYGTDPNRLNRMAESPYEVDKGRPGETHRVKLDHLRPGTTYYYIVDSGQGQGTGTEARSRVEQFTTRR
ncbi:MAG TPA: fibronectin type III domain-containing protein [Candidatus Saccharimonadales bacterium]|nr:fibronectin type III domain-containing protein [Candidatus Saccharimonadales bacterium]